jgi:hypothetical protein
MLIEIVNFSVFGEGTFTGNPLSGWVARNSLADRGADMLPSIFLVLPSEESIFAEALMVALRARGLRATTISVHLPEILRPDVAGSNVLILSGNLEEVRMQIAAARTSLPEAKIIAVGRKKDKELSRYLLSDQTLPDLAVDSFEKLVCILRRLREIGEPECEYSNSEFGFRLMSTNPGFSELTIREQEVFKFLSAGFSNKDIANLFCISTSTVKNHVHSILSKLNISRRRYALGCTYAPTRSGDKLAASVETVA